MIQVPFFRWPLISLAGKCSLPCVPPWDLGYACPLESPLFDWMCILFNRCNRYIAYLVLYVLISRSYYIALSCIRLYITLHHIILQCITLYCITYYPSCRLRIFDHVCGVYIYIHIHMYWYIHIEMSIYSFLTPAAPCWVSVQRTRSQPPGESQQWNHCTGGLILGQTKRCDCMRMGRLSSWVACCNDTHDSWL